MYESRRQPLLPRAQLLRRIATRLAVARGLLAFSLALGTLLHRFMHRFHWDEKV